MYESFFGLKERPFDLTPNPRYLFMTPGHREALSTLKYGMVARKGLTLMVGDAGTGKTTLIRAALDAQPGATSLYLNNPTLTREEFFEFLARGFGLSDEAAASKPRLLQELERVLLDKGELVTLIIDEAQSLSLELLEEVRLLANIETETQKLLCVILAGQPELADRLNDSSLRQLKQRIALRCELRPLTLTETAGYIAGRIRVAGGDSSRIFTREAVELIHERARGIPRIVSVICDNALLGAFAADQRIVRRQMVLDVCRDFDLHGLGTAAPLERVSVGDSTSILVLEPTTQAKGAAPLSPGDGERIVPVWRRLFGF